MRKKISTVSDYTSYGKCGKRRAKKNDRERQRAEKSRENGERKGKYAGGGGSMKVNGDVLNTVLGVSGSIKKLNAETGERRGRGEGR